MKGIGGLVVLFCIAAMLLPVSGMAVAQEPPADSTAEDAPDPSPSAEQAEPTDDDEDAELASDAEAAKAVEAAQAAAEAKAVEDAIEATERRAAAEAAEAKKNAFTESVTVTATRVETDLMKTPVAVTVFDQETLDREGVHSVADIAQMVPNMDIATDNSQSTPIIALRGIRSTNTTELGDPSVGVHLDGIYSPRMQGVLAMMFDNERVEVLRGPQGTLFGRNSTVGSINIIPARPKLDRTESTINLQYGNYNAPELQAMYNKPISETFGIRFAGRYHQRDSYLDGYWDPNQFDQRFIANKVADAPVVDPCTVNGTRSAVCSTITQHSNWWSDDYNEPIRALVPADEDEFYMDAKEWAYRLSAAWRPAYKDMSLDINFQHFQSSGSGGVDLVNCDKLRGRPTYVLDGGELVLDNGGNPIVNGTNDCGDIYPRDDTYQAVVNTPGEFMLDIMYLRARYSWDIRDNLRLINALGAEDQDRESQQDFDQALNAWDQNFSFLPGTGSRSWSNELQLQSYGNKHFNWIVGANYFHEKTSTIGLFDNTIQEKSLFLQPNRSTNASAIFAQATYSYSPKWHMTMGGRYSTEIKQDRGGKTYICRPENGCGTNDVFRNDIQDGALSAYDRNTLNEQSTDFWYDIPSFTAANGVAAVEANDNRASWDNVDWRVGLDYQKDDDTLLYSYIATGFKSGGIGDVFSGTVFTYDLGIVNPFNGIPIQDPDSGEVVEIRTSFEEESVTTLELGLKQSLLGGKLQLRGAYFFSDYEGLQYGGVGTVGSKLEPGLIRVNGQTIMEDEFPGPDWTLVRVPLGGGFVTRNIPSSQIQGIELEYDWRAWTGGKIRGYVSWLDAVIDDDFVTQWDYDANFYFAGERARGEDPPQVNLKNNDLAVAPPIKIHATIDHAFFFEERRMTLVPWITAHWETDSYLTIWNVERHRDLNFSILDQDVRFTDDKRDAWSMFHAGLSLYHGNLKAELYGYNLTDEVIQWWGGAAEGVSRGSFSMPITYGFRMGYNF